jgi:Gpi18-like mannosyltransferase
MADIATVVLVLVACSVFIFGGFRESIPFGRLSITSGFRPLAIAAVVLLLRHWAWREPSLIARARLTWIALRASAAWRATWPVFVSTRLAVLLVGFFGLSLIGYAPKTPPWRVYENDFLNLPARWDTGWYLAIAERGYSWEPANASGMQNIAFFPAFPTVTYYVSLLMGRQTLWAGVLVSLAAFLAALHYLFRFARSKIGDDAAAAAIVWIAAYPFALFFSAAYTESLFLLAAVAACYHFERDELLAAAGWGVLAGLSRPNGCLLSVVLALIAIRDVRTTPISIVTRRVATAAAPGVGMLIFSAYIYQLTGNPLEWANNHAAYGRVYRGIGDLILDRIDYISINGVYNYVTVLALDVVNLIPILFAIAAIVPVYRLLGAPYAVMIAINVLLPVLMGGVLSMGRVTAVLFPLFIWLGAAVPATARTPWLLAFAMAQALFAIAFFTWRPLV